MSIKVQHVSFSTDPTINIQEKAAADRLRLQFEKDLKQYPQAQGTIYILTSIRLFGQKRDDIDLLVIGLLSGMKLKGIKTKNYGTVEELNIRSFIVSIELKSHSSDNVEHVGIDYIVRYPNCYHNASQQCREAKFSLVNHLDEQLSIRPFICDILWFDGLSSEDISKMRGTLTDNALPRLFSFRDFITTALRQTIVYKELDDQYYLDSFNGNQNDYERIVDLFTQRRIPKGLTKAKFELISQNSTEIDKLMNEVGTRLTILTGRAGTGKTVQLLQLAFRLADERDSRCLLLTYNHALVSDIKRLIDFTPMPTKVTGKTVSIKTIDSFFQGLMLETGVLTNNLAPTNSDYRKSYNSKLKELYTYIINVCNKEDIDSLKEMADQRIDWDYILIDEAQDFSDDEKKILFKIYGVQRIVVADGVDQFMRDNTPQRWNRGVKDDLIWKPKEMVLERRQKASLVTFVNAFAKLAGINWRVCPNDHLNGGSVLIYPNIRRSLFRDLKKNCNNNGCENYDILFLVPPSRVITDENGHRHFELVKEFESAGIPLFDGTNNSLRTTYPIKDQCRLYQYNSCRGLEGWCVVCADFDELIKYKISTYQPNEDDLGYDLEVKKQRNALLWALMPLTRPVDTLVITLKDPNSNIGKMLKQLSEAFSFVTWGC